MRDWADHRHCAVAGLRVAAYQALSNNRLTMETLIQSMPVSWGSLQRSPR